METTIEYLKKDIETIKETLKEIEKKLEGKISDKELEELTKKIESLNLSYSLLDKELEQMKLEDTKFQATITKTLETINEFIADQKSRGKWFNTAVYGTLLASILNLILK